MHPNRPISKYRYFLIKRCVDVCVSLVFILLVYPWLMPVLMLLITWDSKGPLFFRQKRTGYLGKTFTCTKFRTMMVNDEADSRQADENDPRITRVGRFLRKSGLDELPQLISVLRGDMSIIGPRPHMLKDTEFFSGVVAEYDARHLVRPGITGIAQIKGYRGISQSMDSIYRRYQWDLYYVRNNSWLLDTKIFRDTVVLTVKYIFKWDRPQGGSRPQGEGRLAEPKSGYQSLEQAAQSPQSAAQFRGLNQKRRPAAHRTAAGLKSVR